MKRCPECRKDYLDDSLLYCLDDGTPLVQGAVADEPATAILSGERVSDERPTRYIESPHETDVPDGRPTESVEINKSPFIDAWRSRAGWIVAGILLLVIAGTWLSGYMRPNGHKPASSPIVRYEIAAPDKTSFNLVRWPSITISPDGSTLVTAGSTDGNLRLFARRRDETAIKPIAGTEGATHPVFSPDGKWIAFLANRTLKKVSLDGQVTTILKVDDARGISWASDDSLVFTPDASEGLFQISAEGGEPKRLTTPDTGNNERTHRWPQILPDGKTVIFTLGTVDSPDSYEKSNIVAFNMATGASQVVLQGASIARYSPTGHLIFAREGNLYGVGFDAGTLSVSGKPQMVMQGVAGDETTGMVHFAIAEDGTLAYVPGGSGANMRRIAWVDRKGGIEPTELAPAQYNDLRLSPDGSRAAILTGSTGSGDVWVYDLARGTSTRLTFNTRNSTPIWSADGKDICYAEIDPGRPTSTKVMCKPADGSRDAEPVTSLGGTSYLKAITPDGASAIFDYQRNTSDSTIVQAKLEQGSTLTDLVKTPFAEYAAALAPDGRWLAYQSNETGRPEIYVRDMSGAGGRWQVSTGGGEEPRWSQDGRDLYYRNGSQLMSVAVATAPTFQAGKPEPLFGGIFDLRTNSGITYDVDPKGNRFLMMRPADESTAPSVMIVLNWFDELRRLVPAQ
jgi:Tol biopolymer transport system component